MPLADQDTGVVDRLGKTGLEYLGLKTTFQEIFDLKGEHVIETHARLVQHADSDETTDEGIPWEDHVRLEYTQAQSRWC
jgi:HD superfamily phosphodiesterase